MAIEIMVGLPHLRTGPILNRARAMQVPTLISANALPRWNRRKGRPEWQGWRLDLLKNADGLSGIALDSAGFVALSQYRGFPWATEAYLDLAASYPFRWFASMDYCVEPEIAPDREEVRDRISRTIRVNRDCWRGAHDRGIAHRFMPVIRGRVAGDYEKCIDALGDIIDAVPLIGIGSMCRRPVGGSDGVIAIFEHLDRILGSRTMIHGLGIKGTALSKLRRLERRVASTDSQAFGLGSRIEARQRGSPRPTPSSPIIWSAGHAANMRGPSALSRPCRANCRSAPMTDRHAIHGRGRLQRRAPKSGR
ncbi:hypothetical protein SLG_19480 [Sphingobium sp. SYK-6]|uniref:deazapurine DNA modification protein DpdA family protein n=1 Tax=Sphingobium sp. (strain NBRC 103272 / SYK-6) TaxID=627192 RepID=UPI00022774F0|nr:hypothetical protein SLG_19480 [Sphingobium sp. SYK-6]